MRIPVLSIVLLLLFSLANPGMAAVVPDADNLPRDAGAPALPGGRHDFSRPRKDKSPGPDTLPPSGSSSTTGTASGNGKASSGTKGPAAGSGAGTDTRPTGDDKDRPKGTSAPGSADAPPASVIFMGVALLLFVIWAGWKSRQGDKDD